MRSPLLGFTFIEMLIVISITGILITIVVTMYISALDAERLTDASESIVSLFQKARGQTLASKGESRTMRYGLHLRDSVASADPNEVAIVKGDSHSDEIEKYSLPSGIDIVPFSSSSFCPAPEAGSVRTTLFFEPLTGNMVVDNGLGGAYVALGYGCASATATIQVRSRSSGKTKTITIIPTGVIQIQ